MPLPLSPRNCTCHRQLVDLLSLNKRNKSFLLNHRLIDLYRMLTFKLSYLTEQFFER